VTNLERGFEGTKVIRVVALGLEAYESNEKIKVWVRRGVFLIIVG
jgi:hypothetical protein